MKKQYGVYAVYEHVAEELKTAAQQESFALHWPQGRRHSFAVIADENRKILSEMHFGGRDRRGVTDTKYNFSPLHNAVLRATTMGIDSQFVISFEGAGRGAELNRLQGVMVPPTHRKLENLGIYGHVNDSPSVIVRDWEDAYKVMEDINAGNFPFSGSGNRDYHPNNCNTGLLTVLKKLGPRFAQVAEEFARHENARDLSPLLGKMPVRTIFFLSAANISRSAGVVAQLREKVAAAEPLAEEETYAYG